MGDDVIVRISKDDKPSKKVIINSKTSNYQLMKDAWKKCSTQLSITFDSLSKLVVSIFKALFYLLRVLGFALRIWGKSAKKAQEKSSDKDGGIL